MLIPKSVPAGEYVLNWRYDCEVRKTNNARFWLLVGVILNYKFNDHFTKTGSGQTNTGKALKQDMRFPQESNQVWQKTHIFCAIVHSKRPFYQDRLGTNIGKTLKKCAFLTRSGRVAPTSPSRPKLSFLLAAARSSSLVATGPSRMNVLRCTVLHRIPSPGHNRYKFRRAYTVVFIKVRTAAATRPAASSQQPPPLLNTSHHRCVIMTPIIPVRTT